MNTNPKQKKIKKDQEATANRKRQTCKFIHKQEIVPIHSNLKENYINIRYTLQEKKQTIIDHSL